MHRHTETDRHVERHTDGQINRQVPWWTDGQTHRHKVMDR